MQIYLLIFATAALQSLRLSKNRIDQYSLFLFSIFAISIIGFRYQVGGDWVNYLPMLEAAKDVTFTASLAITDPAYAALNWASNQVDGGIYLVNLVCGAIFMSGLTMFCLRQPLPWLALTVATPYLLIVVAMGYTRQSAALGFIFIAFTQLQDKNNKKFIVLVLLAALFHKSAIALLPLLLVNSAQKNKTKTFLSLLLVTPVALALIIDTIQAQWNIYIEQQMQSEGGATRIWMNAIPAILLWLYRKEWAPRWPSFQIWKWLAIAAVICIPLLELASTATDRLALYIAPLQIVVYSHLPLIMKGFWRYISLFVIIIAYMTILLVWLSFSPYASCCWIPYQSILFQ